MGLSFEPGRAALILVAAIFAAIPATVVASDEGASDYPEGCVSCHIRRQGQTDLRLGVLLNQIGHPEMRRMRKVPRDCIRCHTPEEGSDEPKFSQLIHAIHYDVPATNTFVTVYGGDCQECHQMDAEEGEAIVKTGATNW